METETKRKGGRLRRALLCLLCLVLGAGIALGAVWQLLGVEGRTLVKAWYLIENRFVGEYNREETLHNTLNAMVASLGDRWSYYLTPEGTEQVLEDRENAYVGIGVTVSQEEDQPGLKILTVLTGGPAEAAGLQPGETILAVDGVTITTENRAECVEAIRGETGTELTLQVQGADGTTREVTLTRAQVHSISAAWTMLEGNVGYVTIANFYSGTAELAQQGIQELQDQGAKALIFDVRYNPGGYVTELTDLLDFLLPEGDIFIMESTTGERRVYTSDESCVDLPMAVLVNGDSYSAAEFFAAQLQESAGAAVVGEKTSGKGYSQLLYSLPDGSSIGLSTARYYTGGGTSLIGTGLTPDPEISLSEQEANLLLQGQLAPEEDPQLQGALECLGLGS